MLHLTGIDMKKLLILLFLPLVCFGQYTPEDSVYNVDGKIRYWQLGGLDPTPDSAIVIKYKTDAMLNHINDTLPDADSILQAQIDALPGGHDPVTIGSGSSTVLSVDGSQVLSIDTSRMATNDSLGTYTPSIDVTIEIGDTATNIRAQISSEINDSLNTERPFYNSTLAGLQINDSLVNYSTITSTGDTATAVEARANNYTDSQISAIDSAYNVMNIGITKTDTIEGNANDTTILNTHIEIWKGIELKTYTESFSVSKNIYYKSQYDVEITQTNNATYTIDSIPEGASPKLANKVSGGDYTLTISGATQAEGNESITLQEVDGAVDLIQFDKIFGVNYFFIQNIVIP